MQVEFFKSRRELLEKYIVLVLADPDDLESEINYGLTMNDDLDLHCVCHPLTHPQCQPDDSYFPVAFDELPFAQRLAATRRLAADAQDHPDSFRLEELPYDLRGPIMDVIARYISTEETVKADAGALKHMMSAMTVIMRMESEQEQTMFL